LNRDKQKKSIERFLKGNSSKDIDVFCIYQWIDRCYYEGWWDLGIRLASHIPPNSLTHHYEKRLAFIISEFRNKSKNLYRSQTDQSREKSLDKITHMMKSLDFDNSARETLRQIYSVLYFMKCHKADFPAAVLATMKVFDVKDYQTVCDKCARRFAGTVDTFKTFYEDGEIQQRLNDKFF
jgi:hypothetical protein